MESDLSPAILKCYYDEKMLFLFSADSDFIFGKNAPCQLLLLNFKNKSDFLTTISLLNCPPLLGSFPVGLHLESWIDREGDVIYSRV